MRGILDRGSEATGPADGPGRRAFAGWYVAALALAALPVVAVRYPPVLDLPQQLAQIDLFGRALSDPAGLYRIQWWQPDKIGFPLLALARFAGGDAWGPRLALLLVEAAWIAGVFALAARRARVPEQAALATLFLWSGTFFGGFVHFLLGVGALAFWVPELAAEPGGRDATRIAARTFLGAALLWLCHALWLAAAFVLVPLALLSRRADAREWRARAAGLLPWAALAAVWYPTLARQGWDRELFYGAPTLARLASPSYTVSVLLGGLRGPAERWAVAMVLAWLAAGFWSARSAGGRIDRALAALGLVLLVPALVGPESVGDTALFGRRWGWVAAVCLVLAVPPPRVRPALRAGFVATLLAGFSIIQLAEWRDFERRYMAGFDRLLAPIGRGERVLGLDFVRRVPGLWVHPLFQMPAYAQLERDAELGYSFAETASSLVVYRDLPAPRPWTPRLEHHPDRLTDADLDHFAWVLAVGVPDLHAALLGRFPRLAERAQAGPWRLYAVGGPGAEAPK